MEQQGQIHRIVKSKIYIDDNLNSDLTVDLISQQAFFSIYHYIRLFKIIYGQTPYQYLKEKRIDAAKQKLTTTDLPVMEICFECGFDSIGSFSTLFKSITGLSPRQYRQRERKRQYELEQQPLKGIPHCLAKKFNLTKDSNFQEF